MYISQLDLHWCGFHDLYRRTTLNILSKLNILCFRYFITFSGVVSWCNRSRGQTSVNWRYKRSTQFLKPCWLIFLIIVQMNAGNPHFVIHSQDGSHLRMLSQFYTCTWQVDVSDSGIFKSKSSILLQNRTCGYEYSVKNENVKKGII